MSVLEMPGKKSNSVCFTRCDLVSDHMGGFHEPKREKLSTKHLCHAARMQQEEGFFFICIKYIVLPGLQ